MRLRLREAALLIAACAGSASRALDTDEANTSGPFGRAIAHARARVVKVHGAGYGSGVVISEDGDILTTASVLLEGRSLRVVLPDGRSLPARVSRRDERRQLALLKVEALELPHFKLSSSAHLRPGDWLIAAANPFKVAAGPEPVSVSVGVLTARTNLDARRGTQDFPYRGPVLLTDVLTTAPGSAGGALVDIEGNLVGLIGKRVISKRTNTWLNYALPVEELRAFLAPQEHRSDPVAAAAVDPREWAVTDLGLRLLDFGARDRPAYVERVRAESPASRAGIKPNDLVMTVNGERAGTCAAFYAALRKVPAGERIRLVIKRGEDVRPIEIDPEPSTP